MSHQSMASRDYVRINFLSEADSLEVSLINPWALWSGKASSGFIHRLQASRLQQ